MSTPAVRAIEDAIRLCLDAKDQLGSHGSKQARLMLDMLLLDLARDLAKAAAAAGH